MRKLERMVAMKRFDPIGYNWIINSCMVVGFIAGVIFTISLVYVIFGSF